jgi:hypothetical protein
LHIIRYLYEHSHIDLQLFTLADVNINVYSDPDTDIVRFSIENTFNVCNNYLQSICDSNIYPFLVSYIIAVAFFVTVINPNDNFNS